MAASPRTPIHVPPSDYAATLAWLYGLEAARGMDFKLERVERALATLGDPQRRYRTIHIAGTNGKGSVAATCHSLLRQAGLRVGLYTSPHLVDFSERIRVDDACIATADVVAWAEALRPLAADLTFFELTTVMAFAYFARAEVEVAVIEVGLGGRLDATNVIDADVAVITSIGFDHEAFLGSTLASIAREKAGILKPRRPAVIGALPAEAMVAVADVAQRLDVPLQVLGQDFHMGPEPGGSYGSRQRSVVGVDIALRGRHQRDNAALAIAAVDCLLGPTSLSESQVRTGLQVTQWPGRLEVVSQLPLVVFDAAHNPDGARALVASLAQVVGGRPVDLLFGVLRDKRWREMVETLAPHCASVTVTSVPNLRSEDATIVAAAFAEYSPARVVLDPCEAFMTLAQAAGAERAIVVAGSVFLIGAIDRLARRNAPVDASDRQRSANDAPIPD